MKRTGFFSFISYFGSIVIAISLLCSCEEEKHTPVSVNTRTENRNAEFQKQGMRAPEPVIVDSPSQSDEWHIPDSVLVISIAGSDFLVSYFSDTIACSNVAQLDSLIKVKGGQSLNGQLALRADRSETKAIDDVIDLLKRHEIIRFQLVTDLEQQY